MADPAKPPSIECGRNGPYIVTGLVALRNSKGEDLPVRPRMALCRCGGSNNKPFCDGTHAKIGFSGERPRTEPGAERVAYRGRRVTIFDDRAVCAHAGNCTDGLPHVWKLGGEPWIDADGAEAEAILDVVSSCPSGALSCAIDGVDFPDPDRDPLVTVSKDGPYHVVGGPELRDEVTGQRPQSKEHYALCRCGGSRNKPFCDGTHWRIGFRDERNS